VKDYNSALDEYKKALNLERGDFMVMNNISYIYLQRGLADMSILYAQMALDINGNYVPALINLGIANAGTGNMSSAEDHLSRAVQLDPGNQDAMLNLAILHERQGEFSKASGYYEKLMKLGSGPSALGLARSYEKQGRMKEAVGIYRKIQSLDSMGRLEQTRARQRIRMLLNSVQNRAASDIEVEPR
jgi:tetratricopeptide (TPR) repeat protein